MKVINKTLIILLSVLFVLSSCSDEYTPVNAPRESCVVMLNCPGSDGKTLLNDKKFKDGISVYGENSKSKIPFDIRNISGEPYVVFETDLPDQNDMKWDKSHNEATGLSNITVKFGKEKAELRCMIKYIANLPPAPVGGRVTLEEVVFNNRSFKRSGNGVRVTVNFDVNGKIL